MNQYDHLFVYGTLKKGFENETAQYLQSTQIFLGKGYFPGLLFQVSFYPGAVYVPNGKTVVYGHFFKIIQHKDELIARLDRYEGVGPEFSQPNEYIRRVIPVTYENKKVKALTYLYNLPFSEYPVIENGVFKKDLL